MAMLVDGTPAPKEEKSNAETAGVTHTGTLLPHNHPPCGTLQWDTPSPRPGK
jgi:hypothetical protein